MAISLFAIALAIRLFFVLVTPYVDTTVHRIQGLNDEPAHFNYVKYVAVHHAFPVQIGTVKDPGAFERNDFEYYQPPLYYVIGAALCNVVGMNAGFRWCRFFSFLCGIFTVVLVGLITRQASADRTIARCSVLFAALLPVHAYFSALVSNDSLSWLLAALIIYELVSAGPPARLQSLPWLTTMRLAAWLAAGMLTKSSTLFLFGIVAGYFAIGWFTNRNRGVVIRGLLALGIAALIAAPWYVRDLQIYHSLFALNMGFGPPVRNLTSLKSIAGFVMRTVHYFWYPMQNLRTGSSGVKMLGALGGLIVLAHGAAAAWYLFWKRPQPYGSMLLTTVLLFAAAAYVSLNISHSEPEARFLLPGFAAIAFYFAAPAVYLGRRVGREWLAIIEVSAVAVFPYLFLVFAR